MQSLKERQTRRSFSPQELPLDVLSNLLWAAFGINRPQEGKRTAPSAHNAQEINIYVAMKSGLYIYNPENKSLDPVLAEDIRALTGKQDFTKIAPVVLIYVANLPKLGGERDSQLFYSAVDTGYISQNVYLFCASENLATVVLGWVDIESLSNKLNLDKNQKIILTQPVGYPR